MPMDIASRIEPARCGVLVFECQEGVVGDASAIPGLAAAARDRAILHAIADLLDAARSAGVRVFYCAVRKRPDGIGNPFNTPLEARLRDGAPDAPAYDAGPIVAALSPEPGDVVIERAHGMTGFYESGLDAYLRNTGVRTVIPTGVSLNVGIVGTTIEAVNRGYDVVVPSDCVVGDPPEYGDQVLRYSIRNLAYVVRSSDLLDAWK